MLEYLFGNQNVEKILLYLLINDSCYATELKKLWGSALSPIQNALDRLESGGIIVSTTKGRTRIYTFNPRYPFLRELQDFLRKAYKFLPNDMKLTYYEPRVRRRPRKRGKPL